MISTFTLQYYTDVLFTQIVLSYEDAKWISSRDIIISFNFFMQPIFVDTSPSQKFLFGY